MLAISLLSGATPINPNWNQINWNQISFAIPLAFLVLASIRDWRHREVSDWLWVAMLICTTPLTFVRLLVEDVTLKDFLVVVVPAALIAIVFCELEVFGGADAKAIICIAFAVPFPPSFSQALWPLHTNFSLGVFTNAMIVVSLMMFYALYKNVLKMLTGGIKWEEGIGIWRKCLILLSSYFVSVEEFQQKKTFLSRVDPKRILPHHEEEKEEQIQSPLPGQVLVTPQLPLMVFISIGYVLALELGDMMSRFCLFLLFTP